MLELRNKEDNDMHQMLNLQIQKVALILRLNGFLPSPNSKEKSGSNNNG